MCLICQQRQIHHPGDGGNPLTQTYAPTPRPAGHPSLPSPPRTDSSHSQRRTDLIQTQPDQSTSRRVSFQSNRSSPNPFPVAQPHGNAITQPQNPFFPAPPNNPSYSNPQSNDQLQPFLGIAPPDQPILPYSPYEGLPSPEAQPSAQAKRKRARYSPEIESHRQKRQCVSPPNQQPVASSSRVTLDTPSRQTTRKKSTIPPKPQTTVSTRYPSFADHP